SAVAISLAVVVPAPAYSIASAVEMLVWEKMKLPGWVARSWRCMSMANARLPVASAAASSALTAGAVARTLSDRSSVGVGFHGGGDPPRAGTHRDSNRGQR